jgi:monofunctional glycosyltransferase
VPPSRFFAAKGNKPRTASGSSRRRKAVIFIHRPLRWIRRITLAFVLATVLITLFFGVVPPPATPLMLLRTVEQATGDDPVRLEKDWTPLERISPHMVEAVIAAEDQGFFQHRGFDFGSIAEAFAVNQKGKRTLGASTISQQTAKNLFLWPARSWLRKGLEAYFTLLIETFWTKRRVLTVYLNVIETGRGVYGVEAAARRFFGVPAARLTREQAALIAAVLPNPRRWSPAEPTAYIWARQAWILRQMQLRGSVTVARNPSRFRMFFRKVFGSILRAISASSDAGKGGSLAHFNNSQEKTVTAARSQFDPLVIRSAFL